MRQYVKETVLGSIKYCLSFPLYLIPNAKTTLKRHSTVVLGILVSNFFNNVMITINLLPQNIQYT